MILLVDFIICNQRNGSKLLIFLPLKIKSFSAAENAFHKIVLQELGSLCGSLTEKLNLQLLKVYWPFPNI